MLKRLQRWCLVLALILSIGGHWAILQSLGWVGMFGRFAAEGSLTEAVVKTFDGKHACAVCKIVTQGKASEKKREMTKVDFKVEFVHQSEPIFLLPPRTDSILSSISSLNPLGRAEPPAPPPRLA